MLPTENQSHVDVDPLPTRLMESYCSECGIVEHDIGPEERLHVVDAETGKPYSITAAHTPCPTCSRWMLVRVFWPRWEDCGRPATRSDCDCRSCRSAALGPAGPGFDS